MPVWNRERTGYGHVLSLTQGKTLIILIDGVKKIDVLHISEFVVVVVVGYL